MSIFNLFKRASAPATAQLAPPAAITPARGMLATPGAVQYPPHDPGLPIAPVAELMEAQQPLIRRLKVHAAQDAKLFQTRFLEPLSRVAGYVSNLPAGPEGIYSGPGGLFRASVELAFGAFQAADGRIFTGTLGVEERHRLEVRWRYVCFLAGLLWPLGRTLEQIKVTTAAGEAWPVRAMPMEQWLAQVHADRVYCAWPRSGVTPGPASTSAALVLAIAGDAPFRWIEEGSPQLATALLSIVTGARTEQNGNAFDVVDGMWRKICAAEIARQPQSYGRLQFGTHVGPHLVDAMRTLLADGKWTLQKAPLFVDASGVYLEWPRAGEDILLLLQKSAPQVATTLGGLLLHLEDAGLIQVSAGMGPFSEIADEDGEVVAAVRLAKADSLIDGYLPSDFSKSRPVAMSVVRRDDPLPPVASAPAPATAPRVADGPPPLQAPKPPAPGMSILESTLAVAAPAVAKSQDEAVGTARDPVDAKVGEGHGTASRAGAATSSAPQTGNVATDKQVNQLAAPEPPAQDSGSGGGGVPEGAEVRHAESLPKDVRTVLKPYIAEQLAQLVALCKVSQGQTRTMTTGVAVPMAMLAEVVARPPDFLQALVSAGFLHVDPSTPGRLVQDIVIPEGTANKAVCFILSTILTKKVGL